jgi:hypothetical protein
VDAIVQGPGHTLSAVPASGKDLRAAVELATRFDATLKIDGKSFARMLKRYVPPMPFSRDVLFRRMLAGEPSVLTGFPLPARGSMHDLPTAQAGIAIMDWLAKRKSREKHRVFVGPKRARRALILRDIAAKWQAQQTSIAVTDLHIRETEMEEIINPDSLSAFNILCRSSAGAREQEMFSFVISSRGCMTDSHSDAPDSTNFCFIGKKLWLAWDTYEGLKHGLQDVERISVPNKAKFDIETWLSLRSARWFVVSSNDTLFLPAHLTHKVITLEPYVGVGGFFIALPNCLRLLSHWIVHGPLWSKADATGQNDFLITEIADSIRDLILKLRESPEEHARWGYDYLEQSAQHFIRTCPAGQLRRLWSDPHFRRVADAIKAPWPVQPARA